MNKNTRRLVVLTIIAAVAVAGLYWFRYRRAPEFGPISGKLVVHFLDIGQGDSELIQLPDGETMLIDAGDHGAPTVNLLRKYGVRRIDLIIATHPHTDHIGEMRDIMRAFEVKEFWDSGFPHPTGTYTEMLQEIRDQGIAFSTPKQGERRMFGQVLVEVLHPAEELPDDNPNNASLVVRLTFGRKRFLFTGDSEVESWRQMMETEPDKLRADVLKAAHHGSSNGATEDVLNAVRPSIITISCAGGNDYHHPHPKVVRMLKQRRNAIQIYRTDLEGTITAVCDGSNIQTSTEKQVARDRLYLTGDEAAGKVVNGERSEGRSPGKRHSRRSR
ncbi:MAG: MBL fold metallo-hydrolase [Acidobacteria bacterium]|nr:MBL fold metallo-hydrolase [Acidobacteriota bacterium]